MSQAPISSLRQRIIDDMTARRFKNKVQKDYVRHVRNSRPSSASRACRIRSSAWDRLLWSCAGASVVS
jgi:hypothetical protein